MQYLSILTALFLAFGANAQFNPCGNIPATIASEVTEMNAFNNRVPPPVHTSSTDCATAKRLKSGIDAFRAAELGDPADGCAGQYATAVLGNTQFNSAYTTLGKFVASC
ncbi:hypothetical protein C8R43DRAFT_952895 [Mycena crocata]|nr:hypothetical protein C8R43DRAFT_952895 [Mycena crocata]